MFGLNDNNQISQPVAGVSQNTASPVPDLNQTQSSSTSDLGMSMPTTTQADQTMSSNFSSTTDLSSTVPSNQNTPTPENEQVVASTDLVPDLSLGQTNNPELEDLVLPGDIKPQTTTPDMTDTDLSSGSDSELDGIKNKALKEITPLLDKLDLPPLEKFKTIMMTIQAGDNKELIPSAYQAAEKIESESEKAQALLDVINEINYFSNNKK